jgi:hypothetical protein
MTSFLTEELFKSMIPELNSLLHKHLSTERLKILAGSLNFDDQRINQCRSNQEIIEKILTQLESLKIIDYNDILVRSLYIRLKDKDANEDKEELEHLLRNKGLKFDIHNNIVPITGQEINLDLSIEQIRKDLRMIDPSLEKMFLVSKANFEKNNDLTMRKVIEQLVKEIIQKENLNLGNFKQNLESLQQVGLIDRVIERGKDIVIEHFYSIYSVLSHYDAHGNQPEEKNANYLYCLSIIVISYLSKKYVAHLKHISP